MLYWIGELPDAGAVQLKLICESPAAAAIRPVGAGGPLVAALASVAGQPTAAATRQTPRRRRSQRGRAAAAVRLLPDIDPDADPIRRPPVTPKAEPGISPGSRTRATRITLPTHRQYAGGYPVVRWGVTLHSLGFT